MHALQVIVFAAAWHCLAASSGAFDASALDVGAALHDGVGGGEPPPMPLRAMRGRSRELGLVIYKTKTVTASKTATGSGFASW